MTRFVLRRTLGAAGREGAAGRQIGGIRHHARNGMEPFFVLLQIGDGVELAHGIGMMLVPGETVLQGAVFNDLPGVRYMMA